MEITVSVPDVLVSQARANGLPAEAFVEKLLSEIAADSIALSQHREARRDALAADWQHYETTGLHLNEEDVDGWLARLANGEDVEPPALHT